MENHLCDYGCGQPAIHQFKNGKWCCNNKISMCKSLSKKRGNSIKKSWKNEERRKNLIERNKTQWKNNGVFRTKKYSENLKNSIQKSWTIERKKLISEITKNEWLKKDTKLRSKDAMKKRNLKMKNLWNDKNSVFYSKNYWKNRAVGENLKPNKPETLLIKLFKKLKLNYKYVGDYKLWIDGKNPDFINDEKKKIIEFFGWRHTKEATGILNGDHEQTRIDHFNKNGYNCLVIWENELKNINDVIQRILEFER